MKRQFRLPIVSSFFFISIALAFINTCQGLELDYAGIVIGNDMKCRNGKILTDVSARSRMDKSIQGIKTLAKKNRNEASRVAERIIKGTYRTLISASAGCVTTGREKTIPPFCDPRLMGHGEGCYIYCCDRELEDYFRKNIAESKSVEQEPFNAVPVIALHPRVEPEVNEDVRYVDFLPYYSIRAACGILINYLVFLHGGAKETDIHQNNNGTGSQRIRCGQEPTDVAKG